jgi:hypothetical protein
MISKPVRSVNAVPLPRGAAGAAPATEAATVDVDAVSAVLRFGDVQREVELARRVLKQLPVDRDHYGGNLQILIGALRRAREAAEDLLEVYFDG